MFTVMHDNGAITFDSYSAACLEYRVWTEFCKEHPTKLIEDGFIIKSTDATDFPVPYPLLDCIGVRVMHTARGPRAFVIRYLWHDEFLHHVTENVCDYDAVTMYDVAVQHAKMIAQNEGSVYAD